MPDYIGTALLPPRIWTSPIRLGQYEAPYDSCQATRYSITKFVKIQDVVGRL